MTIDNSAISDVVAMRRWLDQFETNDFVRTVADRAGKDIEWCRWALATFSNEALVFAPTLAAHLKPGDHVLEVGSGIGFLSLWLHRHGVDICALDPAPGPFDPFTAMAQAVAEQFGEDRPELLQMGAENLDPVEHGQYNFIFSFNVLEHVEKLEEAFAAIAAVLKPGGRMLHSCPNYAVPYEPHLSIPLVPWRPKMTERLFRRVVGANKEVWDSLNFISIGDVRRLARRNGLEVKFDRGLMYERVERLWSDKEFSSRHFGSPIGRLFRGALAMGRRVGLVELLRYLPAGLATPMLFVAEKPGTAP